MTHVCSTLEVTWKVSATCAGCGNHLYPETSARGCSCKRSQRNKLKIVETTVPSRRGSGVSKRKGKGKSPSLHAPVPNDWVPTFEDLTDIFGTLNTPEIVAPALDLSWLYPLNAALPDETETPPFFISSDNEVQDPNSSKLVELDDFIGFSSAPAAQKSLEDVVQSAIDTSVASDDAESIAALATELQQNGMTCMPSLPLVLISVDEVDVVLMSL